VALMSVCCESCVLSARGLCVGLITRPEESYRMCSVSEWDREASTMRRPWHTRGCRAVEKKWEVLKFVTDSHINMVVAAISYMRKTKGRGQWSR
jgi:hypothetical protein